MAQQPQQEVFRDQLCPPNKQYDLIDATKKIDLVNPQCPNESKILGDILNHHPLLFSLVASASFLVDDFRRMFQLPQATDNNNDAFVDAPTFSDICLTTRVTRHDQQPFQIMQMIYYFINNIHVDYAELLWEGLHYSPMHPTRLIPYPRFMKIIIDHFMTKNPDIPKRLHEHYYRVTNDEIVKSIFKSWKNKEDKIMWIPDWMLTKEMKLTRHYELYVFVFRVDVPTTQSQPTKSTQGTHRTLSAPRTSNPVTTKDESSAPRKPTIISTRALMDEEIEQIIKGDDNVNEDEFMDEIFNSEEHISTRLELESHKEIPKVEKSDDVLIINNDWE
ncbi:hypothetical protein Tco_1295986, partial [Tanacetum coccineum]